MAESDFDAWSAGQSYEHYMGRWSRKIAAKFIDWVNPPANADWLEIGCGTGALTETVLRNANPKSILATDQSPEFVAHAAAQITDGRVAFKVADATNLPCRDANVDIVTSALVLNFIPDKSRAFEEMQRVLKPSGTAAFYVWDYPGEGMGSIDAFWKSAAEIDPDAADLDESARFPFCQKQGLKQLCHDAGASDIEISAIEVETQFPDFEAFWHPFTLGAGPAPGYVKSLPEDGRRQLRDHLKARVGTDGPVSLPARTWAVKTR